MVSSQSSAISLRESLRREALLHAVLWAPDMEVLPSSMNPGVLLTPLHLAGREDIIEDRAWQCWPLPSPTFFGANFKGDWAVQKSLWIWMRIAPAFTTSAYAFTSSRMILREQRAEPYQCIVCLTGCFVLFLRSCICSSKGR